MPRRSRHLAAAEPQGRDATTGTFATGNAGGRATVVLQGFDLANAAEWMRPHLALAQRRYRGARMSGLFKRTGSRLDGMLRAACLADAQAEALTAYACTLATPADAKPWLDDARTAAREARTAWAKLFATVGVTYDRDGSQDPLSALARTLGGADD